jgi:hypothetical protein
MNPSRASGQAGKKVSKGSEQRGNKKASLCGTGLSDLSVSKSF